VTFARAAFLATSHSCSLRQTYLVGSDDCSCDNRKAAFGAQASMTRQIGNARYPPSGAIQIEGGEGRLWVRGGCRCQVDGTTGLVCPQLRKCRVHPGSYAWCHEETHASQQLADAVECLTLVSTGGVGSIPKPRRRKPSSACEGAAESKFRLVADAGCNFRQREGAQVWPLEHQPCRRPIS
jgi:hypothetical protein